jgi:hypothetical protein
VEGRAGVCGTGRSIASYFQRRPPTSNGSAKHQAIIVFAATILNALLPELGPPLNVHNSEHLDLMIFEKIQYLIRESSDQDLPGISIHYGIAQRTLFYLPQTCLNLIEKLRP